MKTFTFLSIICYALCIMSCGDDPIAGCTDPTAANYNAAATEDSGNCSYPGCTDEDGDTYDVMFTEDDGSCTYFDRFVGSYSGTFICQGIFADLLNEASAEVTKKTDEDNVDLVRVVVSNPATEINLILDGTITKDDVVIDTYIPDFEYTLDFNGLPIEGPYEIFVNGTLTRSEDGTLTGPMVIRIAKGSLEVQDNCDYTAMRN